ncbi:hypothetical protein Hypma_004873 [Hypsizygus marmoreus]|uniref:Uncharacterized protein n=1 Tax=Hypsizygus marmoreus TaxID=39966 RepID=A0A369J1Y5_HYPMA|nr:hypothetical protein Hypma_004873 [Hypsizygus marmoreus]
MLWYGLPPLRARQWPGLLQSCPQSTVIGLVKTIYETCKPVKAQKVPVVMITWSLNSLLQSGGYAKGSFRPRVDTWTRLMGHWPAHESSGWIDSENNRGYISSAFWGRRLHHTLLVPISSTAPLESTKFCTMPSAIHTLRFTSRLGACGYCFQLKSNSCVKAFPKDIRRQCYYLIIPPTARLTTESEEPAKIDQGYLTPTAGDIVFRRYFTARTWRRRRTKNRDPQNVILLPDDILDEALQKHHFFLPPEVLGVDKVELEEERLSKRLAELQRHCRRNCPCHASDQRKPLPSEALSTLRWPPEDSNLGAFRPRSGSSDSDSDVNVFRTSDMSIDNVSRSSRSSSPLVLR